MARRMHIRVAVYTVLRMVSQQRDISNVWLVITGHSGLRIEGLNTFQSRKSMRSRTAW